MIVIEHCAASVWFVSRACSVQYVLSQYTVFLLKNKILPRKKQSVICDGHTYHQSVFGSQPERSHSSFARQYASTHCKALKLAVDSRSGDTLHHDWDRPAGRPRTTWMSQIVRDTGLTAADAWALADDRLTWRALRPTAGYAQQ